MGIWAWDYDSSGLQNWGSALAQLVLMLMALHSQGLHGHHQGAMWVGHMARQGAALGLWLVLGSCGSDCMGWSQGRATIHSLPLPTESVQGVMDSDWSIGSAPGAFRSWFYADSSLCCHSHKIPAPALEQLPTWLCALPAWPLAMETLGAWDHDSTESGWAWAEVRFCSLYCHGIMLSSPHAPGDQTGARMLENGV